MKDKKDKKYKKDKKWALPNDWPQRKLQRNTTDGGATDASQVLLTHIQRGRRVDDAWMDDAVLSTLFDTILPLDVPLGDSRVTLQLTDAEFASEGDNVHVHWLDHWEVHNLALTGTGIIDAGFLGTHDEGVRVVVDIVNTPGPDNTVVTVQDFDLVLDPNESNHIRKLANRVLNLEFVRSAVCDTLSQTITRTLNS